MLKSASPRITKRRCHARLAHGSDIHRLAGVGTSFPKEKRTYRMVAGRPTQPAFAAFVFRNHQTFDAPRHLRVPSRRAVPAAAGFHYRPIPFEDGPPRTTKQTSLRATPTSPGLFRLRRFCRGWHSAQRRRNGWPTRSSACTKPDRSSILLLPQIQTCKRDATGPSRQGPLASLLYLSP